jgi:hypothetical protein
MTLVLETAPPLPVNGHPSVSDEAPAAYEYAIDQQALAFQLSVLTQDFTFFSALRADDTRSDANPGKGLIPLGPNRAQAVIDQLLSYSNTAVQAMKSSFETYATKFRPPGVPHGEDPPPPGGAPSPLPQIVHGWIQNHMDDLVAAVDKSASGAKALIKDLPNDATQQAAAEVWARGLREVVPAAQLTVKWAYAVVNPVPGLPFASVQQGKASPDLTVSGRLIPIPDSWIGDILGAIGTALTAIGNAIAELGRAISKAAKLIQ